MKCERFMDVLLSGLDLDTDMQRHRDGCEACRGRQALTTQLAAAGEAVRCQDLPDAAKRETRDTVVALLNETETAPAPAWSLRPLAVSGGALASAVILAVMIFRAILNPGDEQGLDPLAVNPRQAAPPALQVAELEASFDAMRDDLSDQIETFQSRHELTDGESGYALRIGRLSDRVAMMTRELETELTAFMP